MKLIRAALLVAVGAVSPALALDAGLLRYVGPDAKEVAGVYVDRVVNSPLGVFVQSQAGGENRHLQAFIESTGFDPRRDLQEIVIATPGGERGRKPGLVVGRGVFNSAQIGAAFLAKGGTKETYNGVDVYSGPKGMPSLAFPEPAVALIGDAALIRAALDRRTLPAGLDSRLADKVESAGSRYDIWFATLGQPGIPLGKTPIRHDAIDMVSGGLTFGSVVQLSAEAVMTSEKEAQALNDVIRFLLGIAELQRGRNPRMDTVFNMLRNSETRIDGANVLFTASVPQEEIEKLIRERKRVAARQ